jgi:hypothetical protein
MLDIVDLVKHQVGRHLLLSFLTATAVIVVWLHPDELARWFAVISRFSSPRLPHNKTYMAAHHRCKSS